jgi:hypothetical protein
MKPKAEQATIVGRVETSTRKILECYNLLITEGYVATWDELRAAIGVAQISIGLTDGLEDADGVEETVKG